MTLREALKKLLRGNKKGIDVFAHQCQNMALVYLKSKVASGNYFLKDISDDLEDLAWDCVADLFERDEDDNFVQLERYFANLSLNKVSEGDLKIKTRRLVFSKVNDSIHRIFGNHDHSLSKIIRNIKNACNNLDLEIKRINKSNHIILAKNYDQEKPTMAHEFLEIKLSHRVLGSMNMIDVMKEVKSIFANQKIYRKIIAVVPLARTIRRTFVKSNKKIKSHVIPQNSLFLNEELHEFLDKAIEQYENHFYQTYVESGKVEEPIFKAYIHTIRDILQHHYIKEKKCGDGYFSHLKKYLCEVDKTTYRKKHRQYLEYMTDLIRTELIRRLKKVV